MIKRLVILRHGNTFRPGETPTRVGAKTDLPLVEDIKARKAANWLLKNDIIPDKIYSSPLRRTIETAEIVKAEMNIETEITPLELFTEIDYGVDENQSEETVKRRLGKHYLQKENVYTNCDELILERGSDVIAQWDKEGKVPDGWIVDIEKIKDNWLDFSQKIEVNKTILVCTSNGIIRFANVLLDSKNLFEFSDNLKVATGAICIFELTDENKWICTHWNEKP